MVDVFIVCFVKTTCNEMWEKGRMIFVTDMVYDGCNHVTHECM